MCIDNPIAEGDSLCYHIEFNLDTLSGDGALATQLAAILRDSVLYLHGYATIEETMAALADSLETEWKAEIAEQLAYDPEYRDMFQYNYNIEGSPVENGNDSILSYQTSLDCYLGGAHGSYVVGYYNFDKNTGKLLNIKDIVPADKEMLVMRAMEEQLCKDWEAKDLADLQEKTGITMLGDLYLTNNFLLKNDSIFFPMSAPSARRQASPRFVQTRPTMIYGRSLIRVFFIFVLFIGQAPSFYHGSRLYRAAPRS